MTDNEIIKALECCIKDDKEAYVTYCNRELKHLFASPDDFCSMGERKDG